MSNATDLEIIQIAKDVDELGGIIKTLGGSMEDQVKAAICSEHVLGLHGIEQSGTGYWRDGELLVKHDEE
jgi:hypothetical protein